MGEILLQQDKFLSVGLGDSKFQSSMNADAGLGSGGPEGKWTQNHGELGRNMGTTVTIQKEDNRETFEMSAADDGYVMEHGNVENG